MHEWPFIQTEKKCNICGDTLPEKYFRKFMRRGKPSLYAYCLNCERKKNRDAYIPGSKSVKKNRRPWEPNQKTHARALVNSAIRRGDIIPKPCEVCGKKAQAHHDDYSKPYDVKWLCQIHHMEYHHKADEADAIRARGEKVTK